MKKGLFKKQIPTLIGIGILVLSLIGGVALIGAGNGVFAPRATPQTTPKNIRITNIKDTSFSVAFVTDEATVGFVNYGTTQSDLHLQASDDRDQLSGSVGQFTTHYITLRNLSPSTPYYFTLGTGSNSTFKNTDGNPYMTQTFARLNTTPAAATVYGVIQSTGSAPASGSIVYVTASGMGDVSGLVKDNGNWVIPISTARTTDGTQYISLVNSTPLSVMVQGTQVDLTSSTTLTLAQAQPAQTIVLGGNTVAASGFQSGTSTTASAAAVSTSTFGKSSPTPLPTATPPARTERGAGIFRSPATSATPAPTPVPTPIFSLVVTSTPVPVTQTAAVTPTPIASTVAAASKVSTPTPASVLLADNSVTNTTTDQNVGTTPTPIPYGSNNPYPIMDTSNPSATPLATATPTTRRTRRVATSSALPVTGSTSTTIALAFFGIFLMGTGVVTFVAVHRTYD